MKKQLLIILVLGLLNLTGFAQINSCDTVYHNLQVDEKVHVQDDSLASCYVKITIIDPSNLCELRAMYSVKVYKTKAIYEAHPEWNIYPKEIPNNLFINFSPDFVQGDLFTKASNELKLKLLDLNPTWQSDNILIE